VHQAMSLVAKTISNIIMIFVIIHVTA